MTTSGRSDRDPLERLGAVLGRDDREPEVRALEREADDLADRRVVVDDERLVGPRRARRRAGRQGPTHRCSRRAAFVPQ